MNSLKNHSIKQNNEDESKSDSTIQLEFSESVVQMLATTYDNNSNSYSSIQKYYSRKRSASRESQNIINEQENMSKKQRNLNDHLAFSENAQNQQIVSLSESKESQCIRTSLQQQNGRVIFVN
jgi:hypothetical protein